MSTDTRSGLERDRLLLAAVWLVLAGSLAFAAVTALGAPGMFYDEAWLAQQARRFVHPERVGLHAPGAITGWLFGRPFPLFALPYLGSLKSQLLIPSLAIFGDSLAVVRLTTVAWTTVGLAALLAGARRAFGTPTAVVAAILVASGPTILFSSQLEWGPFTTGFLARVLGFWLLVRAWQERELTTAALGGLALGLATYNRADFAIILGAAGLGLLVARPELVREALRERRALLAATFPPFLLSAAPILLAARTMFETILVLRNRGDFAERVQVLLSTLDGSYFYRLMQMGGRFDALFTESAPMDLGAVAVGLSASCVAWSWLRRGALGNSPALRFLLVATAATTVCMLALPGATRPHHMLNLAPFAQLLVAGTLVGFAQTARGPSPALARTLAAAMLAVLVLGSLTVTAQTRHLIEASGGRGLWSNAFDHFAAEIEAEPGAAIVSLDWGFHLPLLFLTNNPQLHEPIWSIPEAVQKNGFWAMEGRAGTRYLVHEAPYDRFGFSPLFLRAVRNLPVKSVEIRSHPDREGNSAFTSVRLLQPHRLTLTRAGEFRFSLH